MDRRFITIALFSIYTVIFGSVRFFLEGDAWGFLHHNLWLAWVPLLIAGLVRWKDFSGGLLLLAWFVWLIFLPNSPYIVTDLIHMRGISTLPWFDLILISHFALAGLLAGALSIEWMYAAVAPILGKVKTTCLTVGAVLLSGLGMMMGRDLRLKSEELFIEPMMVFARTFEAINATSLLKAVIYSAAFGMFCLVFQGIANSPERRSCQNLEKRSG